MRHSRHQRHRRHQRYERHDPSLPVFSLDLPASLSVITGKPMYLTVTVERGVVPYAYVWYKDSNVISGETTNTMNIDSVVSGTAGVYKCEVTDAQGNVVVSGNCPVTILPAVSFKTNLSATSGVTAGSAITLTVEVQGGLTPYVYKWTKNGGAVATALDGKATFTKPASVAGDTGAYQCQVTDDTQTTITSVACTVTVS